MPQILSHIPHVIVRISKPAGIDLLSGRRGCPDLMDYCMRPTGRETSVLTRCFNPRVGRDLAVSTPPRSQSPNVSSSAVAVGRPARPGGSTRVAKGFVESAALMKRSHQLCSATGPSGNFGEINDSERLLDNSLNLLHGQTFTPGL